MGRASSSILALSLVGGVILSAWGLWHQDLQKILPWTHPLLSEGSALRRYIEFLFWMALAGIVGTVIFRKKTLAIGGMLCVGLAVYAGALWPLIFTIWFGASSFALGAKVLSFVDRNPVYRNHATQLLVGAGLYGTLSGLAAHYSINYPWVYGAVLLLPVVSSWKLLCATLRSIIKWVNEDIKINDIIWQDTAITAVALYHMSVALMPEVMFDALAIHLFIPAHVFSNHQWAFNPDLYVWSVMPLLGDWIYTISYMLAGETGARLVNLGFILISCAVVRDLVVFSGGTERGARWAVLVILSIPLTYTVSSSLFIESIWTAFMVTGLYWMIRISTANHTDSEALKTAGMMLGFASAAKAITLTFFPSVFLLLIYKWKALINIQSGKSLIIGVLALIIFGCVPYVTAQYITGNPVFPYFNAVFNSPYYPNVNFNNPVFQAGLTWDLAYQMVFNSDRYIEGTVGASGFQWLTLLVPAMIAVLIKRNKAGIALMMIGFLSLSVIFYSQSYIRYIYPIFCLFAALIGIGLSLSERYGWYTRGGYVLVASLTIGLNMLFITSGSWAYRDYPLHILSSESATRQYIVNRVPVRRAVALANALNTGNTPIAMFSQPFGAELTADALYPNWYNHRFNDGLRSVDSAQSFANLLSGYRSDILILDANWGTPYLRSIIEKSSQDVASFESISVRTIRDKYKFTKELIQNPDLTNVDGWTISEGAVFDAVNNTLRVTVDSPAYQIVDVDDGRNYLAEITFSCDSVPSQGRVQINWLDSGSRFMDTDISVFDCSDKPVTHSVTVTSPKNAAKAVVYASGHTEIPIIVYRLEFKK